MSFFSKSFVSQNYTVKDFEKGQDETISGFHEQIGISSKVSNLNLREAGKRIIGGDWTIKFSPRSWFFLQPRLQNVGFLWVESSHWLRLWFCNFWFFLFFRYKHYLHEFLGAHFFRLFLLRMAWQLYFKSCSSSSSIEVNWVGYSGFIDSDGLVGSLEILSELLVALFVFLAKDTLVCRCGFFLAAANTSCVPYLVTVLISSYTLVDL